MQCLSFVLFLQQLSQAAASIDNRVPTPASVASADTNSQQLGPDAPMLESKSEVKTEETEPETSETQVEAKTEVNEILYSLTESSDRYKSTQWYVWIDELRGEKRVVTGK